MNELLDKEPVPSTPAPHEHAMWADTLSEVLDDITNIVDIISGQVNGVVDAVTARAEAFDTLEALVQRFANDPELRGELEAARTALAQGQTAYADVFNNFVPVTSDVERGEGMQQLDTVTSEVLLPLAGMQTETDEAPENALKAATVSVSQLPGLIIAFSRGVRLDLHQPLARLPADAQHLGAELDNRLNSFLASQSETNTLALKAELNIIAGIINVDVDTAVKLNERRLQLREPIDGQTSLIKGAINTLRSSASSAERALKSTHRPVMPYTEHIDT